MYTNMTGFRCFSKSLHPCALDEGSCSIERAKQDMCKICTVWEESKHVIVGN